MNILLDRIKYGKETVRNPLYENENSYGKIEVDYSKCKLCKDCIKHCIVDAIKIENEKITIDSKGCIYCGNCIDVCQYDALKNTHNYKIAEIGDKLREEIYKKFNRSLILRSVDTGSCNACMLELSATTNNFYSISKYGVNFAASPRHSDGIVVTGPVPLNMKDALIKTYYAMPQPRLVIAVGSCACDGGIFKDTYANCESLNKILPVDLYIPGCPPSPQAIIYGLLKLMQRI
ncbi:NADH-quinone oxidoreductase subunit NuoB [Caloramator sp. mosi_1]|uniref:NADH-quinone oxidoreductase subunit NuoB n=1 Tax=Caloramator sp. mosi_1 TaxID=3023090 RepID=UPI002360CDC4|nr:NADH-quinone oxidoreductase subunit NuoB [Caloramator sp. mosi_1]WDC85172.1 NADH-quinone oxidoreductase subunit NuoB [Caloramator sp. mosi_1]